MTQDHAAPSPRMRTPLLFLPVAWLVLGSGSLYAARPTITTQAPAPGPDGKATLSAKINPGGELTTVTFQYGRTSSYGSEAKAPNVAGDVKEKTVSVDLTGLVGGTDYYFRVVAENASSRGNPVISPEQTFKTEAYAPTVTLTDATRVRGSTTCRTALRRPFRSAMRARHRSTS